MNSTNIHFRLDGPVFGLGEGVQSYDLRGTKDAMANGEGVPGLETFGARLPIPWVISPSGWGLFIGQPSGDFIFTHDEGIFRCNEATSTRNVFLYIGRHSCRTNERVCRPDRLSAYAASLVSRISTVTSYIDQSRRSSEHRYKHSATRSFRVTLSSTLELAFVPQDGIPVMVHSRSTTEVFPDPGGMLQQMHENHFQVVLHMVPPGDLHGEISDTGVGCRYTGR